MIVHSERRTALVAMSTAFILLDLAMVKTLTAAVSFLALQVVAHEEKMVAYKAATCADVKEVDLKKLKRLHPISFSKIGDTQPSDLVHILNDGSCQKFTAVHVVGNVQIRSLYKLEDQFYIAQISHDSSGRWLVVGRWPVSWWSSGYKEI